MPAATDSNDKPEWTRFDEAWWYRDPKASDAVWRRLTQAEPTLPVAPPGWKLRIAQSLASDGPLPPLIVGVIAAIIALVLSIELFPSNPLAVLGPVLALIGAFTGHAAGHAAAKSK